MIKLTSSQIEHFHRNFVEMGIVTAEFVFEKNTYRYLLDPHNNKRYSISKREIVHDIHIYPKVKVTWDKIEIDLSNHSKFQCEEFHFNESLPCSVIKVIGSSSIYCGVNVSASDVIESGIIKGIKYILDKDGDITLDVGCINELNILTVREIYFYCKFKY